MHKNLHTRSAKYHPIESGYFWKMSFRAPMEESIVEAS